MAKPVPMTKTYVYASNILSGWPLADLITGRSSEKQAADELNVLLATEQKIWTRRERRNAFLCLLDTTHALCYTFQSSLLIDRGPRTQQS